MVFRGQAFGHFGAKWVHKQQNSVPQVFCFVFLT